MHLIPLLRCPEEAEPARRMLRSMVETALPASIGLRPTLVSEIDDDLGRQLGAGLFEWVRTGFTEPWFAMLPYAEIQRQLVREETALRSIGLEPGPLLVTGPWERDLPSSFAQSGVTSLLLPGDALDEISSGVVAHLEAVIPVVPVVGWGDLDHLDLTSDDAVVVELEPGDPAVGIRSLARRPGCDVTSVQAFLAAHAPRGRRRPRLDDWEQKLAADPDRAVLHRKLTSLMTRLPERLSDEAELALLEAEAGRGFTGPDPTTAGAAMVAARRRIETERRRSDDWARVSRLDWDADGRVETHIELPDLSMVLAPARSGAMPVLDHKPSSWPVSTVPGEPGWTLVRMVEDLGSGISTPIELTEASITDMRGGNLAVLLTGELGRGRLDVSLEARGSKLSLRFTLNSFPTGVIGPELKIAFDPGAEFRVDGSPWRTVDEPAAVAGHKFRLASGDRQVIVASLTPASLFLRPGIDGPGLVAWPHWAVSGSGSYEMTIELVTAEPA